MNEASVTAVASGKGGVGKTTTALNLAAGFAEAGRSVVVVDVDLGMANLADALEVDPEAGATIHDVLSGEADLEAAIRSGPGDVDAVVGSPEFAAFGRADPAGLGDAIEALRERYDRIVLDTGGGLSYDVALPLGLADSVVLVTTPEDGAIANTATTRDLVERLDGRIEGAVINRIEGPEGAPESVRDRLEVPVLGAVPEDESVADGERTGIPVVQADRSGPAAQAFREIAYGILEEPLPMDWSEQSDAAGGPAAMAASSTAGARDRPGASPDEAAESERPAQRSSPAIEGAEADTGSEGPVEASAPAAGETSDADEEIPPASASGDSAADAGDASGPGLADAIESAERGDRAGETPLGTDATEREDADEEDSRSLLSRVTGGLFG
ncbi:MAG: P-loop NTPase [Halanaeroarchaeum sp.]